MRPFSRHIRDNENFKPLFETAVFVIGHVFEASYGFNKLTNEEFLIFEFYGDPTCGLVGHNNDWLLVGGEFLVLRTSVDNSVKVVDTLKDIFDLKAIDDHTVQILTDPWSAESAIWELSIDLKKMTAPTSLTKIRNFTEYIDKPYTDTVHW